MRHFTLLFVFIILSACAGTKELTDNLSPSGWFEAERQAAEDRIPGEDEPYPTLTSLSQSPYDIGNSEHMAKIEEGLKADRKSANYSDLALRKMVTPNHIGVAKETQDKASPAEQSNQNKDKTDLQWQGQAEFEVEKVNALASPSVELPPTVEEDLASLPDALDNIEAGVLTNHPLNKAQKINDYRRLDAKGGVCWPI